MKDEKKKNGGTYYKSFSLKYNFEKIEIKTQIAKERGNKQNSEKWREEKGRKMNPPGI